VGRSETRGVLVKNEEREKGRKAIKENTEKKESMCV